MRLTLALLLIFTCVAADAGQQDKTHSLVGKGKHFDIRVRPGSRAAASAEAWGAKADRLFERIQKQLAFTPPKRLTLYLYDSVEEMHAITEVPAAGFAIPQQAHIPFDNEQTAYHEFVHLFAHQLPKTGEEQRDMFFVEGLANALIEYVDGVHVHAVACYYRDTKRLPKLEAISRGKGLFGWMAKNPKLRGYDVAGSFMRHLLDTYDIEAVKRFYTGTPATKAFGTDEAGLEKGWRATLAAYKQSAEVVTLLRRGEGETVSFTHWEKDPEKRLPAEIRGTPGDWKDLMASTMHPGDPKLWKRKDGVVIGSQPGGKRWMACEFGNTRRVHCVVMARLSIPAFCPAIQVRLGEGCQAMYVTNGTFLYRGTTGLKGNSAFGNPGRGEIHIAVARRGHDIRIYVNGEEALHVPNGDGTPARVGVGFLGGTVHIKELKVRTLPPPVR